MNYGGEPRFLWTFTGIPLFFLFYFKGKYSRHKMLYIVLSAVSTVVASLSLKIFPLNFILIILFLFFYYLLNHSELLSDKYFLLSIVILSVLFNFYWILPQAIIILNKLDYILGYVYPSEVLPHLQNNTEFLWRMRLYYFEPRFTLLKSAIMLPKNFLSFLIPVLVFVSLFFNKERTKLILPFAIPAVILLSFYTGLRYPVLKSIYLFLWKHFFLWQAIRDPNIFCIPLSFLYACLFGFFVYGLFNYIEIKFNSKYKVIILWKIKGKDIKQKLVMRKIFKATSCIFLGLVLLVQFAGGPMEEGYRPVNPLRNVNLNMEPRKSYFTLKEYLLSKKYSGYKLLCLPWTYWYVIYTWYNKSVIGNVTDLPANFSPIPTIVGNGRPPKVVQKIIDMLYESNNVETAARLMGSLSIKYILLHQDLVGWVPWAPQYDYSEKEDHLKKLFENYPDVFIQEKDFGEFILYRLAKRYVLPPIYGSFSSDKIRLNESFILYTPNKMIKCKYYMINPTFYKIKVSSPSPFILIFNQSYTSFWRAYVDNELVKSSKHFMVNEYTNAWLIEKTGNLKIELKFWPQEFVWPAIRCSVFSFLLISSISLIKFIKYEFFKNQF